MSASWLACTLTLNLWVPKWTPSLRYFGLPPAQPLRLALMDPTDRYLRAWKPVQSCLQFDQQRALSRFFSLFPTAAFPTIMARRKATAEELGDRAESNGCKRGAYREKDSARDNGKHNKKIKRNQNLVWTATYCKGSVSLDPCELLYWHAPYQMDPLRNTKRCASARSLRS